LTTDKNGKHPGESGFDPQNVVQFGVGLNPNHHPFFQFYALLNQQGNRLLNDKRTALDFPDGDAVSAWQWLQDLFFKHYAAPPGQTAAATDFIAGKTAMMIEGVWQIPAIERAKMKWGTFPYPQVFKSKAVWGNIATFNLPKQSNARKKELAADFIGWILKNSLAWTRGGQHPALKSVAEMEEYKKYPGREGFRQSVPYVVVLPGIPNSAQFYSAAATSAIVTAAQNMLVQNKPVRASLEMMKSGLNALLK